MTKRRLASLLFVLACSACGGSRPASEATVVVARDRPLGIAVNGKGDAEAAPDTAIFHIGVEARMESVEAARDAAARAQQAVLKALRDSGVGSEDLRTTQLTVAPDYDYSEQGRTLRGYVVTNQVEVRTRDVARLQQTIDAALRAGGDLVQLNGLRFELEDAAAVEATARREAMDKARAKAEQLAQLLGVRLGEPLSVEEASFEPGRPIAMQLERAEAKASTPVEPGTTKVEIELRVQWAIE